jgi:hypothetical protein
MLQSMRVVRWLVHLAIWSSVAMVVLAAAGPWAIYGLGLTGVTGRPVAPNYVAFEEKQAAIWSKARATGERKIPRLNPYTYGMVGGQFPCDGDCARIRVASWVARDYVLLNSERRGGLW